MATLAQMKAYLSSILQVQAHKLYWTTVHSKKIALLCRSDFSDGIIVSNSIFQSYRHQFYKIIEVISSVLTLIGNVNFTDSITGIPSSIFNSYGTAV